MSRILIVEDDHILRGGLVKIVRSIDDGVEVLTTGYAEEALDYIKDKSFEGFFLDIELPDFSGIQLAEQIRTIEGYQLTPIVFITAIPVYELEAFRNIHCYDYIVKPFSEEKVKKVFETIIRHGANKRHEKAILRLVQKDYHYIIDQDDIIYIESINRRIHIRTLQEEISLSTYTLHGLMEDLEDDFIQCHKGFIVNVEYIGRVDKTNNLVMMREIEKQVPIGRKFRDQLRGRVL